MKFFLTTMFSFILFFGFSQNVSDEIQKARMHLILHLQNNDWDSISLKTKVNEDDYFYLTMREQELVLLFQKKYSALLKNIDIHEEFMYLSDFFRITDIDSRRPKEYKYVGREFNDTLSEILKKKLTTDMESILNDISHSDLAEEDLLFVIYYVYYTDYQIDICDKSKQQFSLNKARDLKRKYPNSSRMIFVKNYSKHFREQSDFGYSVSLGFGSRLLSKGLNEHFKTGLHMYALTSLSYKRFDLGFTYPINMMKTKKPFQGENEYFEENRKARLSAFAFSLGYSFKLTKHLTFNPFVGASYNVFYGLNKNEEENEIKKFKILRSNGLFYGFNIDLGSKYLGCKNQFQNKNHLNHNTAPFFRFQAGMMHPNLSKYIDELNGNLLFFSLGVGFYMQFVKKTKALKL